MERNGVNRKWVFGSNVSEEVLGMSKLSEVILGGCLTGQAKLIGVDDCFEGKIPGVY